MSLKYEPSSEPFLYFCQVVVLKLRTCFRSEVTDFGGGVTGAFALISHAQNPQGGSEPGHSHAIAFTFARSCKAHMTFSVLDKDDKILRTVVEWGTPTVPLSVAAGVGGRNFTPTAEEKGQSARADGSIRLRAVVRLLLEDAGRVGGAGL